MHNPITIEDLMRKEAYHAACMVCYQSKAYLPIFKQKYEWLENAKCQEIELKRRKFIKSCLEEARLMKVAHDMIGLKYDNVEEILEYERALIDDVDDGDGDDDEDGGSSPLSTKEKVYQTFNRLLCSLTAREERVLRMRSGISADMKTNPVLTLEEVGVLFDITREHAQEIEVEALNKLEQLVNLIEFRNTFGF